MIRHALAAALILSATTVQAQEPTDPIGDICQGQPVACIVAAVPLSLVAGAIVLTAVGEAYEAACVGAGYRYLPPEGDAGWQWRCTK